MEYMHSKFLGPKDFSKGTCTLKFLESYLDPNKQLDESIRQEYPIDQFGYENDELKIAGVETLLTEFDNLAAQKYDFLEEYGKVNFLSIDEDKKICLSFPNQEKENDGSCLEAHGIYNFFNDFLEPFGITKYIDYCLKNGYHDLITENITQLLTRNSKQIKQFRLLRDEDDHWGIRALTSEGYKNYDNGVVLYLSLLCIHKYALQSKVSFRINEAYLTDSFMHVFVEQTTPIEIPGIGTVYFELAVSNGEIRNYKFKVELRYRVVNTNSEDALSAISNESLFNIIHSAKPATIRNDLSEFSELNSYKERLILFIKSLVKINTLSEDATYELLSDLVTSIKASKYISSHTKTEFTEFQKKYIVQNTISLFELFGKLKTIRTDMDEKIFIERIFHQVLSNTVVKASSKSK